ncbi:hypothetical protein KAR91_24620 [Candidatus Pacearchaeota archaeon]|nr:hypothetical protein [Candidatus Pacearchaeota archaeon]
MNKYRKKSMTVKAEQWHKVVGTSADGYLLNVGYFRDPYINGESVCKSCGRIMHYHGWIDNRMGGFAVCPGDWIIKRATGELYPRKPDVFEATYEKVE